MVRRSETSTTPAARLNPTYKLPVAILLCRFDKADGPAAVYTGGLYGLFSRYLAERPKNPIFGFKMPVAFGMVFSDSDYWGFLGP